MFRYFLTPLIFWKYFYFFELFDWYVIGWFGGSIQGWSLIWRSNVYFHNHIFYECVLCPCVRSAAVAEGGVRGAAGAVAVSWSVSGERRAVWGVHERSWRSHTTGFHFKGVNGPVLYRECISCSLCESVWLMHACKCVCSELLFVF